MFTGFRSVNGHLHSAVLPLPPLIHTVVHGSFSFQRSPSVCSYSSSVFQYNDCLQSAAIPVPLPPLIHTVVRGSFSIQRSPSFCSYSSSSSTPNMVSSRKSGQTLLLGQTVACLRTTRGLSHDVWRCFITRQAKISSHMGKGGEGGRRVWHRGVKSAYSSFARSFVWSVLVALR